MLVPEMFSLDVVLHPGGTQLIAYSAVCLKGSYLHSFETTLGKDRFTFRAFLTRKPLRKIRKICEVTGVSKATLCRRLKDIKDAEKLKEVSA